MTKNIVLVGFMGTGKTAVGRRLAGRLGMEFIDTDDLVEEVTGMSISQLFKRYGEVRFRSEEELAVARAAAQKGVVIATGGGAVLSDESCRLLKENGVMVWLKADPDEIHARVKRKGDRPLLSLDNSVEHIKELLAERMPYYRQADFTVETSGKELDHIVDEVVALVKDQVK